MKLIPVPVRSVNWNYGSTLKGSCHGESAPQFSNTYVHAYTYLLTVEKRQFASYSVCPVPPRHMDVCTPRDVHAQDVDRILLGANQLPLLHTPTFLLLALVPAFCVKNRSGTVHNVGGGAIKAVECRV